MMDLPQSFQLRVKENIALNHFPMFLHLGGEVRMHRLDEKPEKVDKRLRGNENWSHKKIRGRWT